MEKKIITFTADEQSLRKTGGIPNYASNKVSYIEAQFELGENWQGFDAVRAIWYNKAQTISMVLAGGKCIVPYEVLANKGQVMVNLVGSISENDVLTDRLTTYPVVALIVDADAKVDGSNTQPITPSQFEQFVEAVKEDADRAEQGASDAEQSAQNAETSATSASESAESAHNDKVEIEQAIAEVIQQIEDFEQVQVVVNTLPPTSPATSDFTDGVLTLGIPQGAKGDTGNGIQSIAKISTSGLVDTYRITYTDGNSTTFTVTNGAKGDTGNGIASIEKTSTVGLVDTYTITYTDGNTSTFTVTNGEKGDKGDPGEVTMSQLSALLPTDTASGSIASFPDGTDLVPAISVKAQIEPIQDLHGYDKPWSAGSGKNLLDYANPTSALRIDSIVETETGNFTVTASGANAYLRYIIPVVPNQTYCIKSRDGGVISGNANQMQTCFVYDGEDATATALLSGAWIGSQKTFTPTSNKVLIQLGVTGGLGVGVGYIKEPQLELGSTATAYEPYSNICPISGHTEVVTSVSPTTDAEDGTTYTTTLGRTVYGGTLDVVSGELVVDRAMVDLSTIGASYNSAWNCWTVDTIAGSKAPIDNNTPIGAISDRLTAVKASGYTSSHQSGTVARNTGGIWFVDNGSTTELTGQLCYELATPQTYQLDPTEVDLLLGQNNVWTDCGSVEVTYKADIQRWVNKKINALI